MELLRFFTAGNVDDGKSSLIGRLLYDSGSVSTDVIEALTRQSKTKGINTPIDLALLTDGLRAEREQGITIDVAYKYFSTARRKFIIADTPGHEEYTRNMFTGASHADLAIILIDAQQGLTDQTKRHSLIAALLNVPNIIVCINKMDLAAYSKERYEAIKSSYLAFAEAPGIHPVAFIPVSALAGEHVVMRSKHMPWYKGLPLLELLETVPVKHAAGYQAPRFQVQYLIRSQTTEGQPYTGFAGTVSGGVYHKGQKVKVLPSGAETFIERITHHQQEITRAEYNMPVVLYLKDAVDADRGAMIVSTDKLPQTSKSLRAVICWMHAEDLVPGQPLLLQQGSFSTSALIREVVSEINIHSFEEQAGNGSIRLNAICNVLIDASECLSFDPYAMSQNTGSFILIHKTTHHTVAAGMIR